MELCIKVGKRNKSILRCTVKKTSNFHLVSNGIKTKYKPLLRVPVAF